MNTQVAYSIWVHRSASSIFGEASKPLNREGRIAFFRDEASARSECDLLNSRMGSSMNYTIEPTLDLTSPL